VELGFTIYATSGTYRFFESSGIPSVRVSKLSEERPNVVDRIRNGEIHMVINTPSGKRERSDAYFIRRAAVEHKIPYFTTVRAAQAAVEAINSFKNRQLSVKPLQEMI